jgi:hypothetical protein
VNDLRRHRSPTDQQAVVEGYLKAGPVNEEFMAVWHVACGIADLVALVYSPEYQAAAPKELDTFLRDRLIQRRIYLCLFCFWKKTTERFLEVNDGCREYSFGRRTK